MQKDHYYYFGLCIGLCLVHGGSEPKCLAPILYHKLANVERDYKSALELMAHVSINEKLLQVCQYSLINDYLSLIA